MAAASTLIDRVLKGFRVFDQTDILAVAINASETGLTYKGFLPGWGPGALVEIENELMLVTDDDANSKVATVVRGWLGTTAVSHSVDTPIYLNPRMLRTDVLSLINDCLADLFGRDLYQISNKEISYDSSLIGYDLDSTAVDIVRVDALMDTSAKLWEPIFDWHLMDNAPTADFPSGKALMVRVSLPSASKIRVIYSKPFTQLIDETKDLELDAGLRPYMTELPFYFAMNRLMVDSERRRSQIESAQSHQRAQDSPPFLALRTGEWYQARYNERVKSARAHLLRETKRIRGTGYGS